MDLLFDEVMEDELQGISPKKHKDKVIRTSLILTKDETDSIKVVV